MPTTIFSFLLLLSSLLLTLLLLSTTSTTSTKVEAAPLYSTAAALYVLDHGNLTGYINTLYTINEPLPDGTPRIGGQAQLSG